MTEAIFACKKIKELSFQQGFACMTAVCAILPGFPENFFVCYRPGNAGDGYGKDK